MSFIEKLKSGQNTPQENIPNFNYYESSIPPAEGKDREGLEKKAEKLLSKDLSPAVYNEYVDTMIQLLGTHGYNENGVFGSWGIRVPAEADGFRMLGFKRDKDGSRSIETSYSHLHGSNRKFSSRHEELNLSPFAHEAIEDHHIFGELTTFFEAPHKNLMTENLPSFIAQQDIELEVIREQTNTLNLQEVKSFLDYSYELYNIDPEEALAHDRSLIGKD